MPEQIVQSQKPLKDAIAKVTSNGRDKWVSTGWTTPGTANLPTKIFDPISREVGPTFGLQVDYVDNPDL